MVRRKPQRVQRLFDVRHGAPEDARRDRIVRGMLEDQRRETAELGRARGGGELDDLARIAAEAVEDAVGQRRAGADVVVGEKGLLQEVAADAGAAAEIAQHEAPAANGVEGTGAAGHEDGARAEDGDGAVLLAERALQRDQRVAFHRALGEGKAGKKLLLVAPDIGAGEAEHGGNPRQHRGVAPGVRQRKPRRRLDAGPRAVEIGHDVGRAAAAAPDHFARGRGKGGPTIGAAAVDADDEVVARALLVQGANPVACRFD